MRALYQNQMYKVEQDLTNLKAGAQINTPIQGTSKDVSKADTPLKNPEIPSQKKSKIGKDEDSEVEEDKNRDESDETDSEDESYVESEDKLESSDSVSSSDEAPEKEKKDKDEQKIKMSNKQFKSENLKTHHAQWQTPSKVQLAARSGIGKKLPVFTGRPEEWPLFIASYQAANDACGFTDVENLVRLQECLKGPALESVRGQLLFPKSVPKVISKLRQLYGRPEQLLQYNLDKVRRLEAPKADKLGTYVPFGNAVEQLCDHLEAANLKQHLVNPLLIQDLVYLVNGFVSRTERRK